LENSPAMVTIFGCYHFILYTISTLS